MPNRVLRDWTNSDKIDALSFHGEVFFTRLIMKADDYGCFYADTRLLKANLYPLKLDKVREADLTRWLAECHKAGLIVLYEVNQKRYLQILDFRQRLDKARNKFPLPPENHDGNNFPEIGTDFPAESEARNESETNPKTKGAKALLVAGATPDNAQHVLRNEYHELVRTLTGSDLKTVITGLKEFIHNKSPQFIEPYQEFWNLFAGSYGLAKVEVLSESRKRKFKTRISEPGFDFLKILEKIKASSLLRGKSGDWKVSFDWILENDNNYAKILNGNYD